MLAAVGFVTVGCGGSGGLFATVPPPVEFAIGPSSSLAQWPKEGTYVGTVRIDRVTYRYIPAGTSNSPAVWRLEQSVPVAGVSAAQATVGAGGAVRLRNVATATDLFNGTLNPVQNSRTTVNLTAADGTSAVYPYRIEDGTPLRMRVMPHDKATRSGGGQVTFDQYSFEFDLKTTD